MSERIITFITKKTSLNHLTAYGLKKKRSHFKYLSILLKKKILLIA